MKRLNLNSWIGKAAIASLLLIPGLAHATDLCSSLTPSYTYTPVAAGGGYGSVSVSAPGACTWHVESHNPGFITITSAAIVSGSGTVSFYVAPNPNKTVRRGTFGTIGVQYYTPIPGRSTPVPTASSASFVVTLDEAGR
jgi:hypothetical protein